MEQSIKISYKLRIYANEEAFLGRGPVKLLENIIQYGSISKGAAAMEMSYRKAWQLVENMNQIAGTPLVVKRLGGKKGGGAEVTEAGREAIHAFHQLEEELNDFLAEKAKKMNLSFL